MNISGYRLGKEIATNKYFSVYNALDIEANKPVNVRVYSPELAEDKTFCNRFQQLVERLAGNTLGIMVPIRDTQLGDASCYLVTDYFHSLQQESLPLLGADQLLVFTQQLASTLSQLHSQGIVHGAVTTANLHFSDEPRTTLGLPAFHRTLTSDTIVLFSDYDLPDAQYLAPEASESLTPATDFYALGVVLYELLFRQKPFDASTVDDLLRQKNNYEAKLPDKNYSYLAPLFGRLLTPDPGQRITDADTFNEVLQQCGVSVEQIKERINPPKTVSSKEKNEPQSTESATSSSWTKLAITLILVIIVVGIAIFFLAGDNEQQEHSKSARSEPRSIAPEPVSEPEQVKQILPQDSAQKLFEQAKQDIAHNNYGSALLNINNALKLDPEHVPSQKLKAEIETEFSIRARIKKAQQQLQQGHLTKPPGNNAYETYQVLAKILPANDGRLRKGLEQLASSYYNLASKAYKAGDLDKANNYVDDGSQILPDYAPLASLKTQITKQQAEITQLRQQEQKRAESERQLQLQRQKEQEQARIKKQRQLEQQQREAELQRQKLQEISRLLSTARDNLKVDQLSLDSIARSRDIRQQLLELAPNDPKVSGLNLEIIDAYGILANAQKNDEDYEAALETIETGLSMDNGNEHLLTIRAEVDQLLAQRKQKDNKREVPIIGTF